MIAMLLNPPKGRKRRRRRHGKAFRMRRRRSAARRGRSTRARRACAGLLKRSIQNLTCGPGASKRFASLSRRCPISKHAAASSSWLARFGRGIGYSKAESSYNGRRRRRRRNCGASFNYRRRSRNYSTWLPAYGSNPYWTPSYAYNPSGSLVSAATSGFSKSALMGALPVVGGVVGNVYITRLLTGLIASRISFFAGNIGSLVLGLASAGILGAGVGMIAPRHSKQVLFGGLVEVMARAVNAYILPRITGMLRGYDGMDYLTVNEAASAVPLSGMEYLTVNEAAGAIPLNGMGHDAIEETASDELMS